MMDGMDGMDRMDGFEIGVRDLKEMASQGCKFSI
jgi:hypothetical protein